jgi:RNA polymerase sigma-70 factor (ECF subfamily)
MPDVSFHTAHLHDWLGRIRDDDQSARNELAEAIGRRVEQLARGMLRRFSNVRRDADTLDVAQGALLRVLAALSQPGPQFDSTRQFMGFVATCIRSELLDLARRYGSAKRGGGKIVSASQDDSQQGAFEPAATLPPDEELELWTRFHEQVAELPDDEREVVGLRFYHGWTEREIAELLEVSERTVRRRWVAACVRLEQALGGEMPC